MVNRVLLDTSLKVSRPGFDVLTATPGQLLFSSDLMGLGVCVKGSLTTNGTTVNVNFGKTFTRKPWCDIICLAGGTMYSVINGPLFPSWDEGGFPPSSGFACNVELSRIRFYSSSSVSWAYVVWESIL
ncbi:hypothetical protein EV128_12523 [Rhizobium azibense]|nr:hypothetical protein EV128_12523 [Rhizobium azibense]